MYDFKDKVLLLTGAAGGIGGCIARQFYDAGANLVLGDIDPVALERFARELSPTLDRITLVEVNSAERSSVDQFVQSAIDAFGTIDFVVPSAGIYPEQLLEDITDEKWRLVMSINLDGVFYLLRACIPHLTAGAAIINIASVSGHRGSHSHAHYAATKAAVISLTRSLAMELGPRQIRTNAVSPGIIRTPMIADFLEQRGATTLATTPLGRLGEPEEVASVVAFLASPAASFVNGEVIHINGGMFLAG